MDFQNVADCLSTIAQTGSTLQKEALLRRYEAVDGFKDVLKFIYDPYFTTGLKQAKLDNADLYVSYKEITAEEVMAYLRVNSTGTLDDASYATMFIYQSDDPDWQWAATGLVTKDLQIGVSVTTLNKVYGKSFIPKIGIMRGMLCPEDAQGYYIATEKIDGNRRLIMNKETGVEIYTRSGKRDTGLYEIEQEAALLPKGYVYDCECVASGEYADSIELRQASASILNRRNQKRNGVMAMCFDMIAQEDYDNGISRMNALGRKTLAASAFHDGTSIAKLIEFGEVLDREAATRGRISHYAATVGKLGRVFENTPEVKHIKVLPILGIAKNKQDGIALAKPIWDVKGEGVMLVDYSSAYEVNPNPRKTLLKIKMLKEFECMCTGVCEGTGKYVGMLGAIIIDYVDANGNHWPVSVGSGFTDADREYLWNYPEKIIWHTVEIDSFGESQNKQGERSLNCPIFKRIKGAIE